MPCCQEPTGRTFLRQLLARREDIAVYPANALDLDEPPEDLYFYRPGEVLVPNEPEQVALFEKLASGLGLSYSRTVGANGFDDVSEIEELDALDTGRTALRVPVVRFFLRTKSELEVILRRLESASRRQLKITPNHVLFGCPVWLLEPFGDPSLPLPGQVPVLAGGGSGVTVAVVDTGVPQGYQDNFVLSPIMTTQPEEEPWSYSGPVPVLTFPQGHGPFVAGVVRQAASEATISSYRALEDDISTDEYSLGNQLTAVLTETGPLVINLSLGTQTRADEPLMGLGQLQAAADRRGPGAPIVVAAAGNMASPRPFYPAASFWAIGVGATQATARGPVPASFTDWGDWVDVCANGVDVLSSFEDKPYQPESAPGIVDFGGFALWSGTSFATPHVSGVVAGLLAAHDSLDRAGVLAQLGARAGAVAVPGLGCYVA